MARTKYTERFCGYCNKNARMVMLGGMQGVQDKIWFKCTRCHHMALIESQAQASDQNAKLDAASAAPYRPESTFLVGQQIFHAEWNDVGKILSKNRISDGSESILVSFEKLGERRLIQSLKPEILHSEL